MPSSSSSAADTPPAGASSEDTLSNVAAEELHPGDIVEFGVSRMSSVRVQDMQQLGYFGGEVGRVPGAEEVPEPEGELVVFEAFFAAGLRLPAHRFVAEVLRRFEVQVHQLTPNAVVALAKYVWMTTSYGGQPSVIVFAKHYCPQFEIAEDDEDEGALRCAVCMSSGRDLVEEFVGYGVWPLAHGWALGEVCPREMPSRGGMLVQSPAFALDLHGRHPAAFVREAEDSAARIVGRYVSKTEGLRSWDIRGSNDRLNWVFELNRLPYGGYPREDVADRRRKKLMGGTEEGPSQEAAPATKKRKLGTRVGGKGVSDNFAVELMGTCAAPGGRMSSPELQESSA
jgi:hypothetical protein